jgi:hypothetical protein
MALELRFLLSKVSVRCGVFYLYKTMYRLALQNGAFERLYEAVDVLQCD